MTTNTEKCPDHTTATLYLEENFAGEKPTNDDLTFYTSSLMPYLLNGMRLFTTYEGMTCGHYFAQEGTNEQTPFMAMIEVPASVELTGTDTFDEFCIEWKEHFKAGYPFMHGQKMLRVGYEDGRYPSSKKSFGFSCLDENANLQAEHFIGLWGSTAYGSIEWFENTGIAHPMDRWVTWRVWIKLNTPGESDGFVRITANGKPFITADDVNLRGTDPRGYNWWWVGGNYSMEGGVGGLTSDGHRYITGLRWWNTAPEGQS
jgi:hypothetical protein